MICWLEGLNWEALCCFPSPRLCCSRPCLTLLCSHISILNMLETETAAGGADVLYHTDSGVDGGRLGGFYCCRLQVLIRTSVSPETCGQIKACRPLSSFNWLHFDSNFPLPPGKPGLLAAFCDDKTYPEAGLDTSSKKPNRGTEPLAAGILKPQ